MWILSSMTGVLTQNHFPQHITLPLILRQVSHLHFYFTDSTLLHEPSEVVKQPEAVDREDHNDPKDVSESFKATQFLESFETHRSKAKETLLFSQAAQQRNYNQNHLSIKFEEGDWVLINPHSLKMLRHKRGLGKKLQVKYDGPFEVLEKISPITY